MLCCAALPGGRGRGPPPQQRRRDSLPEDVSLVTELKRHEKVRFAAAAVAVIAAAMCLAAISKTTCDACHHCGSSLVIGQGRLSTEAGLATA